eukprot:9062631-Pyramimonas_sp.AAC.2
MGWRRNAGLASRSEYLQRLTASDSGGPRIAYSFENTGDSEAGHLSSNHLHSNKHYRRVLSISALALHPILYSQMQMKGHRAFRNARLSENALLQIFAPRTLWHTRDAVRFLQL